MVMAFPGDGPTPPTVTVPCAWHPIATTMTNSGPVPSSACTAPPMWPVRCATGESHNHEKIDPHRTVHGITMRKLISDQIQISVPQSDSLLFGHLKEGAIEKHP